MRTATNYSALLSYYQDGDYYESHFDKSAMTILSYFFEEPKQFSGGNIVFSDFNLELNLENNMVVIFPSCYQHEVKKIKMEGTSFDKRGRYCVSQFLTFGY